MNTASVSFVLSCAVTAKPKFAVALIGTVNEAKAVQLVPELDAYAVNVLPFRTKRTHCGAFARGPGELVVVPFALVRDCATIRFHVGVTATKTLGSPGTFDSRIITPAFAHAWVSWSDVTCVSATPFPVWLRHLKFAGVRGDKQVNRVGADP